MDRMTKDRFFNETGLCRIDAPEEMNQGVNYHQHFYLGVEDNGLAWGQTELVVILQID